MKTNKKVLSLLLALVMVFSTAVTAFAAPEGVVPAEDFKIKATADLNDVLEGAKIDLTVKKAAAGTEVYTTVGTINVVDGKGESTIKLEPNMDYGVWANDPTEVLEGSSYYYTFSTDADGKVKGELPKFHFDLMFRDIPTERFTVYSIDKDGKAKADVEYSIYGVELNESGDDYKLGKDRAPIVDKSNLIISGEKTNARGFNTYDDDEIDQFITDAGYAINVTDAGYAINGSVIVAFVVNGEAVAYTDLANPLEIKATLREVIENVKVEITVKGYSGKENADGSEEAPKALKGAKVELVPNTTKLFEDVTWGAAVDSKETDVNGKALFENVELNNVFYYLNNNVDVTGDNGVDGLYKVTRWNKLVVTTAEGYQVPVDVPFASSKLADADGVYRYDIVLNPTGYNYIERISGTNRYATSVAVARVAYKEPVQEHVILASGDVYADALVANGLVGLKDSPLVLTAKASLSPEVETYLKDVKAKEVLIVGGAGSVSGAVQTKLESMGLIVTRIAGSNRYDTSAKVLDHMIKVDDKQTEVLLASGENFADALVASVPSALYKQPILLTEAKALSAPVKAVFNNPAYNIEKVVVVGGEKSVSENAVAGIGLTAVERLSGQNRQLTSMKVADKYFVHGGKGIVVDGTGFADALSAGQYAKVAKAPILLTESKTTVGKDLTEYIKTNKMTDLTIVGGSSSVSKSIADQLEAILAGKPANK